MRFLHGETGFFSKESILEGLKEGVTIELIGTQKRCQKIKRVCAELERVLGHRVGAEVFLTPENAQGFSAHYDYVDVFILQLEGKKLWKIWDIYKPFPLEGMANIYSTEKPDPIYEVVLNPGDFLYLPRGYVHEACTLDEYSLHLSVGAIVYTWVDLIQEMVKDEPMLRRALPIGLLQSEKKEKIDASSLEMVKGVLQDPEKIAAAVQNLQYRFQDERLDSNAQGFETVCIQKELSNDAFFKKREGMSCSLVVSDEEAKLHVGEDVVCCPAHTASTLQYIMDAEKFSIGMLPNTLTESGKMALMRSLIRAGLIVANVS